MKILQINSLYGEGSTGKITKDIHEELLSRGIESIVCYGRGKNTNDSHVYRCCSNFYARANHFLANVRGLMYGGCYLSTAKIISVIKKEKPDIVHLQCINGYFVNIYKLVTWLKKNKIKTVLTLHAEFMYTGSCGSAYNDDFWTNNDKVFRDYKKESGSYFFNRTKRSLNLMKRAFDGFDNLEVVSVSPWLKQRAEQSYVLKGKKHSVILNGLNTNIFKPRKAKDLRRKYAPNGEKVILHVTPYFNLNKDNVKGGYYVNEIAKRMLSENVIFLVTAPEDDTLKVSKNIKLIGKIKNQEELARFYSAADLTLLTSRAETFSMVTAESLCCGAPVVGFKAGGPEMIAIKGGAKFFEFGDIDAIVKALLCADFIDSSQLAKKAKIEYNSKRMVDEYLHLYKSLETR